MTKVNKAPKWLIRVNSVLFQPINLVFHLFLCTFATDMEKKNQYMEVSYQLFVDGDNGLEMMEEAPQTRPFQFITGLGMALDAFESQLENKAKGDAFDFSIPCEQAYGSYQTEYVLDLDREMFFVDGHFDEEHIYEDAVIPLQNEEGQRFYGHVVEIGAEKVKVDLNHPLAGETLHFKGTVVENRPATTKEIEQMVARMTGGCGGCGGCNSNGGCGGGNGCGGGCHC